MFRRVIVESPFKGKTVEEQVKNIEYARKCALDCLSRGEAPFLSHLLYTQMLNDGDPVERQQGIDAGLAWGEVAEATVVYLDRGISAGMRYGIENALNAGRTLEYRRLPDHLYEI